MDHFSFWHWLELAAAFLVLELLGSGGFLLWTAVSAAFTGLMAWLFPTLSLPWQCFIFSCVTLFLGWGWWMYLKRRPLTTQEPYLNQRTQKYIGQIYTLEENIINRRGRLRVDDGFWNVECSEDISAGTQVKVVAAEGTILKVEKI